MGLDRLRLQHDLRRPTLLAALACAGLSPGERVVDPDAAQGLAIEDLLPLLVVGRAGEWPARWMEMFVTLYGAKLQALGLWSPEEAGAARAGMEASRADPGSFWVGPTILEVRARRT